MKERKRIKSSLPLFIDGRTTIAFPYSFIGNEALSYHKKIRPASNCLRGVLLFKNLQ